MKVTNMSILNDDGISLNLSSVLILFLLPNFMLIFFTIFNAHLVYLSNQHPRLNHYLGKQANFFAKGALDRIIRNIIQHLEIQKHQHDEQISMVNRSTLNLEPNSHSSKKSTNVSSNSSFGKKYDANYLLLVPFQIELLLTVLVYKILTRDVYFETCQTFLTTYYNRPDQVVCWLKNLNRNVSNSSFNITLIQYCQNQTITYMNYEHNDVMCIQYVFKLINIIDTVTNIFAWHQAIVFFVTKTIVFCHWYQQKLRKFSWWLNLFKYERHIIIFIIFGFILSIYIIIFVIILPIHFVISERQRVDLTRHLLYACSKFLVGLIVHVNIYTFYQWRTLLAQGQSELIIPKRPKLLDDKIIALNVSAANSISAFERDSTVFNEG
ncbi:hypothetical protein I4U23_003063 [Adineta vaga]|nr:hypothetical protein I4U23_003063 [Adineta vaga]